MKDDYREMLRLPTRIKLAIASMARLGRLKELSAPEAILKGEFELLTRKLQKLTPAEVGLAEKFQDHWAKMNLEDSNESTMWLRENCYACEFMINDRPITDDPHPLDDMWCAKYRLGSEPSPPEPCPDFVPLHKVEKA